MNINDGKEFDIGVVVGRFQVPMLHDGHKAILSSVSSQHKNMLVLVGVSSTLGTKENPLPYVLRLQMLQSSYPGAVFAPINDMACDEAWSDQLDRIVRTHFPMGSVRLYGGRDSFVSHYHGSFETFEYPNIDLGSGSCIRQEVGKSYVNTDDFRRGVIWATQNQYPKVWPTVDIAVVNTDDEPRVLMGKRLSVQGKWRFPGGFVDPTDESFEHAARREMREETGLVCEGKMNYLGTFPIKDWRYKSQDQKIFTTLFHTYHPWGMPKANEEFAVLDWVDIHNTPDYLIEEAHLELFKTLQKKEGMPREFEYPAANR